MKIETQKAVKIDGNLFNRLDKWLNTKRAKDLGYHSKAQFITEAVRNHLEEYN